MDTKNNTAESQKQYVKGKKPDIRGYIIHGFIYMSFWKGNTSGCQGGSGEKC